MSVDPCYDEAVEIVGRCLVSEKCGECDRCRMAEQIASIIYSRNAAYGPPPVPATSGADHVEILMAIMANYDSVIANNGQTYDAYEIIDKFRAALKEGPDAE